MSSESRATRQKFSEVFNILLSVWLVTYKHGEINKKVENAKQENKMSQNVIASNIKYKYLIHTAYDLFQ